MQNAFYCSGQPAILLGLFRTTFHTVKEYIREKAIAAQQRLIPYDRCLCLCLCCSSHAKRRKSMKIDKSPENVTWQVLDTPQTVDKTLVNEVLSQTEL